eukprot:3533813-Amphidinium_carterae.1
MALAAESCNFKLLVLLLGSIKTEGSAVSHLGGEQTAAQLHSFPHLFSETLLAACGSPCQIYRSACTGEATIMCIQQST